MHYYRYLSWGSFWCKIWKAIGNYNSGKQPKQTWGFDETPANQRPCGYRNFGVGCCPG